MPDYTACVNGSCPLRTDCARFLMKYGLWQSVSLFRPEGETCTHRIRVTGDGWLLVSIEEAEGRARKG